MLSVLISSRVKNNPDSNIKETLDSAKQLLSKEDYDKIEFLIKYDYDDDLRPPIEFFTQYPFTIKTFVYERGEGRHYNHHFSEYLFANRNTSFKWVMSMADDFRFTKFNFLKDLEEIKEEYMVVGYTRPYFEINGIKEIYKNCFPYNFDHLNGVGEYCPCLTANIVEICQNMGWQPNIDAWIVLLETTLYRKYGFLLWKQIKPFYRRGGGYGLGDTPTRKNTDIYNNMVITGARIPKNQYLFNLIEQQATNLFLNIVYGDNPNDDLVKKKLDTLKTLTPLMDLKSQEPHENWIPWDLERYNKPPIFEQYQIE